MSTMQCRNCVYFTDRYGFYGKCHCCPPTWTGHEYESYLGKFPEVGEDDWCGQFRSLHRDVKTPWGDFQ